MVAMAFGTPTDMVEEGETDTVRLNVLDGNETVVCRVSREALEDLTGSRELERGELLDIAQEHFDLLTDKWMERIGLGLREEDGSVLLRSRDLA